MALVDETKADYVFMARSIVGRPWFELLKRETKQILYAGVVPLRFSVPRAWQACEGFWRVRG